MRFVAVVLVLVVAWLWWPRGAAPPPFAAPAPQAASASPTSPPALTPAPERTAAAPSAAETGAAAQAATDAAHERPLAPGALEVLVLRDEAPIAGAHVRVWPDTARRPSDLGDDDTQPLGTARTDDAGRVVFAALPADRIVVRADTGEQWRAERETVARDAARTVTLRFGTAVIHGRALDADGAPLAGLAVHLAGIRAGGTSRTTTAQDGSYAFAGLAADRYWVQLEQGATWSPDRERQVSVPAGGTTRTDFGPVGPHGELAGRVVDAHGTPIPGERPLRFVLVAGGDERRTRTALDGTFRVALPYGPWRVVRDDLELRELATVELGAFAQLDVPWPGIRLVGHVSWPAGEPPLDLAALRDLHLRGPDGVQSPDHAFAHDGHVYVQWLALAPGDYGLSAQGRLRFTDAPREGVALVLGAEPRVVAVPLNVGPR